MVTRRESAVVVLYFYFTTYNLLRRSIVDLHIYLLIPMYLNEYRIGKGTQPSILDPAKIDCLLTIVPNNNM